MSLHDLGLLILLLSPGIIKIGLAIACQEIKKMPSNSFDKKMNYILTEKKLYK